MKAVNCGRKSSKKRSHKIKFKRIKVFSNIYLLSNKKCFKNKDSQNFTIISISPYTFNFYIPKI